MTVLAVYREFGSLGMPHVAHLPEGETLVSMRRRLRFLPDDFDSRGGVICINGHVVPSAVWGMVKPKPMAHGVPTEVTFHLPPMGGGGQSGKKNILALVASIALTAATGFIAGGGLATKFGWSAAMFGRGAIGSLALAAGVSLAGSLLISSLVPPPTIPTGKQIQNPGAASVEGNVLEPNGAIPRVVGTRKVFPPFACEPLTYFDGQDEVVEAACVMAGPHQISDIRVGAAPIGTLSDVQFEVREGFPGDAPVSLITRQSRTDSIQRELRGHTVAASDGQTLETTSGNISTALPQKFTLATREAPDEHLLQLVWTGGLHKNASETDKIRVPIRLRIRQIGASAWKNLPEIHYQAANLRQLRATIRLVWTANASVTPEVASGEGWVEARIRTVAQTIAPSQPAYVANSYFDAGVGSTYMNASTVGSTRVSHVTLDRYTATIWLDSAQFPPGRYEIEVQRGAHFRDADFAAAAYSIGGAVYDPFAYSGTPGSIPQSRDGVSDLVYLLRSVSIWNENPLPTNDMAVVAISARNRQLESISCVASGWVRDWDGTGWNAWVVTDNPAPHLRDIYAGDQNLDPIPDQIIDDVGLVSWRAACTALGYRCNAVIEDQSVDDAARIVASCGFAKPYMSEIWGVVRDYDRSAEVPVQIFSPRNSAGFRWSKAFPRVPDGFRVNFRDAARDYEQRQITVFRPGVSSDTGRLEQVTYEGLVTQAEVVARATYDQNQVERRSVFYSLDVPAEAIVCRRGSLVGVSHDMLSAYAGSGRVVAATYNSAGLITALRLDSAVPVVNEPDMLAVADLLSVPDLLIVGQLTGAAIRRQGSRTIHALSNVTGETDLLTFSAPISAVGILEGVLVVVGPKREEYLRMIVFEVTPREDLTATLTLVDEAPGIAA